MKSILWAVLLVALFSGCSVSYQQFKDGYKSAKVVYQDVRYVVYEVNEEKRRVDNEGFGVSTSDQASASTK